MIGRIGKKEVDCGGRDCLIIFEDTRDRRIDVTTCLISSGNDCTP